MTAPNPPAEGRNGRWVKLGEVGVDSATMAITDPQFNETDAAISSELDHSAWSNGFGTGIKFSPGFGDGGYDIWAWVVDYGEDDEVDERIAQVVVTMIDADELASWRHDEPWPYVKEQQ